MRAYGFVNLNQRVVIRMPIKKGVCNTVKRQGRSGASLLKMMLATFFEALLLLAAKNACFEGLLLANICNYRDGNRSSIQE